MSDDEKNKDKKFKPSSPETWAYRAVLADNASAGATPFPIGTNLSLSAAGLTGVRAITFTDATGKVATTDSTDTFSNKTVAGDVNTLQGVWQSPLIKRYGEMQPVFDAATTASQGMSGIMAKHTHIGAVSVVPTWDTGEGLVNVYTSTNGANAEAGVRWSAGTSTIYAIGNARTAFATRARCRVKAGATANTRFYFGFTSLTSAAAVPITDAPLGATDSGIMLGYSSNVSSGVWNTYCNDGQQAEVITPTTGVTASDTNWHTLEIGWGAGATNFVCSIDGNVQTAPTKVPVSTTNLYLYCSGQSGATASGISYSIKGIQIETK